MLFFQAEDGIRDIGVTGVQTCALPISGGRGAVVAVVDSGVAYERRGRFRRAPDLYRGRLVKLYDFVENDRHPNEEESHGTHVAGTIEQQTNNQAGRTRLAHGGPHIRAG